MKRLLLAPLFLTLLLSSCKGQQTEKEKYISELDLAEYNFGFIKYVIEEYKQDGVAVKESYPGVAKLNFERATELVNKLQDLIDYQKCLNEKLEEKIIFKRGRSECFGKTSVDLSTNKKFIKWMNK